MDFQDGSFFKLYLEHISRVRNCGDHVLLCFPLTRDLICTVGLHPAYTAAPAQGALLHVRQKGLPLTLLEAPWSCLRTLPSKYIYCG